MIDPKQERFSKLPYPIHKVNASSAEELFQILPGLRRYFSGFVIPDDLINLTDLDPQRAYSHTGPILVKIFKYICFVYDPESDLIYEYPDDLRLLKEAAASEAGFRRKKENGEWPSFLISIMEFRDLQVTEWILDYLKFRKNRVWKDIKIIDEELEFYERQRLTALREGKVAKEDYLKLTKDRSELRDTLSKKFFAEHNDLKKAAEEIMYPVTPENVYREMKIPDEVWKIRQVKDVPKELRPR